MTNPIPDFLQPHNSKDAAQKDELVPEPNAEKENLFMPSFKEHETAEFFADKENKDSPDDLANQNSPDADKPLSSEEISEKYKDVLKTRLPKGSKPPFLSLLEAVEVITDIEELAGGRMSFDALSQIVKNSRSSSSFAKKITALRNFGLIETENLDVKISSLGSRIVAPESPSAQTTAIKEAFLNIEIFAQIYKQFCGKILPQDIFLVNTFKNYVPKDLANIWMEKFKDSAMYARVLLDRGDGKFQVIEDVVANQPPPLADSENGGEKASNGEDEKKEVSGGISDNAGFKPPATTAHENAIKTIKLFDSQKSIWLGSDANILEIKFGKDMDFVLALIKLFDLYERKKGFKIEEVNDDKGTD